jgi:hypothetical protein
MGAGQKVIGALLGHSDSASTGRYTHVAPSATGHPTGRGPMATSCEQSRRGPARWCAGRPLAVCTQHSTQRDGPTLIQSISWI